MSRNWQTARSDDQDQRWIAVVALVMLLLTVLGFVILGIVMKMNGYPHSNLSARWTPIAMTMRLYGHWLLIIPLLWSIYAVISCRIDRGMFSEAFAGVLGMWFLAAIPILFLLATFNAYTRPLIIRAKAANDALQGNPAQSPARGGESGPRAASGPTNAAARGH